MLKLDSGEGAQGWSPEVTFLFDLHPDHLNQCPFHQNRFCNFTL